MVDFEHEAVSHSVGQFVKNMVHTNGIESFWALLKRGYIGQYHKMSVKHLHFYIDEFSTRHNWRDLSTERVINQSIRSMDGHMNYKDLTS